MNIYVYSDESGVFDNKHNEYFVFGGLVFLDKNEKLITERKYIKAEKDIRRSKGTDPNIKELKACLVGNKQKGKLYRSLNKIHKFGVVVEQCRVIKNIFNSKKDKQRYLDYVYKIAVKRYFVKLIRENEIDPKEVKNIYFFVDEHTTATNGCYELKEGLEREFKTGTYNRSYSRHFPPIFPNMESVEVHFCNSESKTLVRAADIVANNIYYKTVSNQIVYVQDNPYVIKQP